ncbi:E3 ubiquitin ligase [Saxophila tyrrhenica]|uniref:E3 ubiquitin ligase n=1 Tax=Saxophila tyrrhenica TaxID=1690608 RepID=A0AAV9PIG0_9PEZI|nr:E3 ubiquitin ligase [Saxophila tyrrhenica]
MASHEGSRKRLKMSRSEARTAGTNDMVSLASASTSEMVPTTQGPSCHTGACQHEQHLKTLNTDVDAMRQLITCKICDRLLYEPYALSCGHTYCYQCLRQWFDNNRHKKTCPDCRMLVTQQPTPSYVLRELVLIFVSRNELLPDGETSDEHHQWSKEEADLVAKDKASTDAREGGLFKGMFKNVPRLVGGLRDAGDGVDRCPHCMWELEGPVCSHCGERVDDSDSDITDDELDHEIDAEDAAAFFGADGADDFMDPQSFDGSYDSEPDGLGMARLDAEQDELTNYINQYGGRRRGHRNHHTIDLVSEDEEDDFDDDDADVDGEMQGFVVDDDDVDGPIEQSGSSEDDTDVPRRRLVRRRSPITISDDEGDGAASAGAPVTEEDSEDEGPIARGSQRSKRGGRVPFRGAPASHFVESSSAGPSDGEDDEMDLPGRLAGFSPLDQDDNRSSDGSSEGSNDGSNDGSSDEQSEPVSSIHPMNASDDELELDVDDFDHNGYGDEHDDEDDDGWGTEVETPRRSRPALMAASHRLHTGAQHRQRHTSNFSSLSSNIRSPPPPARYAYMGHRTLDLPTTRTNAPGERTRHRNTPATLRHAQPAFRAPAHPFQLSNTLASVNSAYNQRAHQNTAQRSSRYEPESSGESGSSRTVGTNDGGRGRKRTLSIASDDFHLPSDVSVPSEGVEFQSMVQRGEWDE